MSGDLALVDTNVLVYALYGTSEHHSASRALLDRAQSGETALCVSPQNLAEFFNVVTNPRRVDEPRTCQEALDVVEQTLSMPGMSLLAIPTDVVPRWIVLARLHPTTRGGVFDHQLAATMLANGVTRIYTYNQSHFRHFEEIEVLTP